MYTYLHNSYNTPAMLYLENGDHILSQEGVTQGDNAAMAMNICPIHTTTDASIEQWNRKWWIETGNGMQMIALQSDHWQVWKSGGNTYRPMDQTLGTALNLQRQSS